MSMSVAAGSRRRARGRSAGAHQRACMCRLRCARERSTSTSARTISSRTCASRCTPAKQGGWALDHFLFAGPPGLGKTTLAHVIATELGVNLHVSSGPGLIGLQGASSASLLTGLGEGDALFIDEIHRAAPRRRRRSLHPAMEDAPGRSYSSARVPHAKAVTMQLPRFRAARRDDAHGACSRRRCSIASASTGSCATTTSPT